MRTNSGQQSTSNLPNRLSQVSLPSLSLKCTKASCTTPPIHWYLLRKYEILVGDSLKLYRYRAAETTMLSQLARRGKMLL